MCRGAEWEEKRLAIRDQTGAGVERGGRASSSARSEGRLPLPLPRGAGWCVPSSQEFEAGGCRGEGSGSGGGGGRLPPQPRQWRRRRRSRAIRERWAECQPAATAQELGVRDARAERSAAAAQILKRRGRGSRWGRVRQRAGGRVGNGADPGAASAVSRRRQSTTFLRFSPRGRALAAAPDATAAAAAAAALPAAALLPVLW